MNSPSQYDKYFENIFDHMLEGCQIIGFDWRYRYLNDAAMKHSRKVKSDLLGLKMTDVYPGIENTPMFNTLAKCMEEHSSAKLVNEFVYPDGEKAWFELFVQPAPDGIFVMSIDITEQIMAEEQIRKLSRVYAVLSDINQAIVRTREPRGLFETACRIAVEKGGFPLVCIGLVDPSSKRVNWIARSGRWDSLHEKPEITLSAEPDGRHPLTDSLRSGAYWVSNDLENDPQHSPWREEALRLGLGAAAAFPLKLFEEVQGLLVLYANEPGFFNEEELKLLGELAMDLSFAMEYAEKENEQKRAEAALGESEERYRTVADFTYDWEYWLAPDGKMLYVSPSCERITGYPAKEFIENPRLLESIVHPDDRPLLLQHRSLLGQVDKAGGVHETDFRILRRDGEVRWIGHTCQPILRTDGTSLGRRATNRDITDRRLSIEALQESESRYHSLFENMLEGFAYCKMIYEDDRPQDFVYLDVNHAFERLTGLKDVIEKNVTMVIPGIRETNPELFEIYGRVAVTGKPEWFETFVPALGIWFSVSVYCPQKEYFVAVFDNITKRKEQELQVQQLNKRLESLIGVVQRLASARDLEDIMSAVRTSARAIVGADGATFVLRDGDECYFADEDAITPLWKGQRFPMSACISGWTMLNKMTAVIPDIYQDPRIPIDAYRPTFVKSLVMVPIRTVDPLGAVGVYWAKVYEANEDEVRLVQTLAEATAIALQNIRFYNELEGRVRERTAQLEAFAYSVSHDLRAPLRAIDGFSRIIEEDYSDRLDAEGTRLLNVVRTNTKKMDQLITDLLAISRVSRIELRFSHIDMTTLVHSIYHEIASPEVQQKFILTVAPLPDAYGDPTLMRQVWSNLLSNAIKYSMPKEDRRIDIGCYQENGMNVYAVKDSGVGFNPDYTHKLFGVFQRLHKAEEFEGSGVGLAIVQRIIHRHGGLVWAEGETDRGATFYFSLPEMEKDHGYTE